MRSKFQNKILVLIFSVIIVSCNKSENNTKAVMLDNDIVRNSNILQAFPEKYLEGEYVAVLRFGETCSPCITATRNLILLLDELDFNTFIVCSENCSDLELEEYKRFDQIFMPLEEVYSHGIYASKNYLIHLRDGNIQDWWGITDTNEAEIVAYLKLLNDKII